MKELIKSLALVGIFGAAMTGGNLMAQQQGGGRGNFDPAIYRERLGIQGDDEWKVIQPRVEKVVSARNETFTGRGGGGRRGGDQQGGNGNQGRGGRGGQPSPEQDALQQALEGTSSNEEIKAKLAKLREVRKAKQDALAKAQDELRKVLSVRQEAAAVLFNLLN